MQISFECEKCGHFHKVDETKVGQRGACRACGTAIRVPVPGPIIEETATVPKHQPSQREIEALGTEAENAEAIAAHIEEHIGPVHQVWHELISELTHIDIFQVEPTDERPYWTLITSGMSNRAMAVPPEAESYAHAELFLCLPPGWPMTRTDFQNELHYWPIRLLKAIARLPHDYETWLGPGHSVGNDGEAFTPYANNTQLCCALLLPPLVRVPPTFHELALRDRLIRFFGVWPIYREEMNFKLKAGLDEMLARLKRKQVTELVEFDRKNTCAKPAWKFWL
jgi:hypothetical protein